MLVLFISIVVSFLISQTYMDIHNEDDTKQLVLYNPPEFIKPFHEKTRTFLVCQHEWKLAQDWHHSGVAGVVWEAVSEKYFGSSVKSKKCSFSLNLIQ